MSKHLESTEHVEQELRSAYLCGCRLLQWMAERFSVDRKSCMMRGMDQVDWYLACNLLVSAGIIDSRLALTVPVPDALEILRRHYKVKLAETRNATASTIGGLDNSGDGSAAPTSLRCCLDDPALMSISYNCTS